MKRKNGLDLELARAAHNEIGKALDSGDFQPPESHQWFFRVCSSMDKLAEALGLSLTTKSPVERNEGALEMMVRDTLAEWDRGQMSRGAFEKKMRDVLSHWAKFYFPIPADMEKLKLVAKLAYQHKFRMQGFILGGSKITPFWDAIDALPSTLSNEAHAEMADEIEEMKKRREESASRHHSSCIGDCTRHSDGSFSCQH